MQLVNVALFGSTGAVGKDVLKCCISYGARSQAACQHKEATLPLIGTVYAYTRRDISLEDIFGEKLAVTPAERKYFEENVKQVKIDFEALSDDLCKGCDIAISCLGSLISKVGQDKQFTIDHDYTLAAAQQAKKSGVKAFAVVSAQGACSTSRFWYVKMKGMMEDDLKALELPFLFIARPGMILCRRDENRPLESILQCMCWADLGGHLSCKSSTIAKSMLYRCIQSLRWQNDDTSTKCHILLTNRRMADDAKQLDSYLSSINPSLKKSDAAFKTDGDRKLVDLTENQVNVDQTQ